jgi:hypothetical protein
LLTILDNLLTRAAAAITQPGPEMRRAIATAHTAAYYAGVKERTGIMPKGLSKVERAELKARVEEQLKYYDAFAAQAKDMSDPAVAARAQLYAGAIKSTYGVSRNPGLPFYPTEGSECMTNCRCEWRDDGDDSYTWVLDAKESCPTCLARADGNPYQIGANDAT